MKNLISKYIKHYQILLQIRETGTRILYKAYDAEQQKYVGVDIVKFTNINAKKLHLALHKQVRQNKSLSHPNIAPLLEIGINDGLLFFVYDFCPTKSLGRIFNQTFSWTKTARQFISITQTLAYLHNQGNFHAFLNPASIVLDEKGNPLLFDFGIEWIVSEFLSQHLPGEWINSWEYAYSSPEQIAGDKPDARSDIYAISLMLFEWLTGNIPFLAQTPLKTLYKRRNALSEGRQFATIRYAKVKKLIRKNLAPNPDNREQTMQNLNILLAQGALGLNPSRKFKGKFEGTLPRLQKKLFLRKTLFATILLLFTTLFISNHVTNRLQMIPPESPVIASTPLSSRTANMIFEKTPQPTAKITPSAEKTIASPIPFPIFAGTALPVTGKTITAENSSQIIEYGLWGIGTVNHFAVSDDGEHIAVATSIGIFIYDAKNLKLEKHINTQSWIRTIEFSPNSKIIASGDKDGLIVLWDVKSNKEVNVFSGHEAGINDLAFSPDGKQLISAGMDNTLRIWSINSGTRSIARSVRDVTAIIYSPDGKYVITGGSDFKIRMWDTQNFDVSKTITIPSKVVSISALGDSNQIAVGSSDRKVLIVDLNDKTILKSFTDLKYPLSNIATSPDGTIILAGNIYGGIIAWSTQGDILWRTPNTSQITPSTTTNNNHIVLFTPDGKVALSGMKNGTVRIINANTGKEIAQYPPLGILASQFVISHSGNFAAFQSSDNKVDVWNVSKGAFIYQVSGEIKHGGGFSSDDRYFSLAFDDSVKVYETLSGEEVLTLNGVRNNQTIVFVHNNTQLAVGNAQTMRLWSLSSGEEIKMTKNNSKGCTIFYNSRGNPMLYLTSYHYVLKSQTDALCAFSRVGWMKAFLVNEDSQQVVVGGNNRLEVLQANGTSLSRIAMQDTQYVTVEHVAVNPANTLIAATRDDYTIGLWNISTRGEIARLYGHDARITDLHFSPDGHMLFSSSADGTIRIWGVP